jgi:hypothetical protein
MDFLMKKTLLALACVLLGLGACSGLQEGSSSSSAESPFTQMPRGNENVDLVFLDADEAFQLGDFVTAQRDFGTLYILDPSYRAGVPAQAIAATCDRLGVDCNLVFGRLDLMQEVYRGRFGQVGSWPPQQAADYDAILQCYEYALRGDFSGAATAGTPVNRSPDPTFAANAQRCTGAANGALAAVERQRQADAALLIWFDNQPCMDEYRIQLLDAFDVDEWETFVEVYPQYAVCSSALMDIIDSGTLEGEPRLGMEHDVAWSDMSEIDAIMEDYHVTYESTREALVELEADPEFNRLVVEYGNLDFEENRLRNQISSLETARDALTGGNRAGVEAQLAGLDDQLAGVVRGKRDVMGSINRLRRRLGLAARDTP